MPITSPDSIYYADGTTPASLADITAAMASSVQNALNLRESQSFRWANATAKSAQEGMLEGDIGYQSDTDVFYIYDGSNWKIWAKALTAYTPTFTNFTNSARNFVFSVAAGIVTVSGQATCSGSVGEIFISLPSGFNVNSAILATSNAVVVGTGGVDDASTTTNYLVGVRISSSTSAAVVGYSAAAPASLTVTPTSSSVPLTWATGDILTVNFSYPVA